MKPLLGLLLLTTLAYSGVVRNGFVYEDANLIAQTERPITETLVGNHRPLTVWTLWADRQTFGLNPVGWHMTSFAVHLVNGVLVYALATEFGVSGLVAAGVFLLHPIQSAGVSYLNGRSELLVATGLLLACLAMAQGNIGGMIYGSAIACFSHEIGIVVVALVLAGSALRVWPLHDWAVAVISAVGIFGFGWWSLVHGLYHETGSNGVDWALAQATGAWLHVGQSIVPIGFSIEYDFSAVPKALQAVLLAGWLAWPAQIWAWRRLSVLAFGLAWVWLTVLPRLLVPLPNQAYLSDHQWYVPFIGLSLAAGAVWQEFLATRQVEVAHV